MYIIQKRLVEKFGEDCLNLFSSGLSSIPEIKFKFILEYYFGEKNVTHTFLLKRKIYDFLLYDKLIIEYDGDYWHSSPDKKEKDIEKNEIAKNNGYEIYRVLDSNSKNPEIIIDIKKLLNEKIQIS